MKPIPLFPPEVFELTLHQSLKMQEIKFDVDKLSEAEAKELLCATARTLMTKENIINHLMALVVNHEKSPRG